MSDITSGFKRTNEFGTDPARQVTRLEDQTEKALSAIATQALPKLTPTNLKTSLYAAALDELVPCAGTFSFILPIASFKNTGRCVAVELRSGTLSVSSNSGLVQNVVVDTLSTAGLYVYVSDGAGWWRPPFTAASSSTVDTSTFVTSTDLANIRREIEIIGLLMRQLVRLNTGLELERGIESLLT